MADVEIRPDFLIPERRLVISSDRQCKDYTATVSVAVRPLVASPLVVASSSAEPSRKMPSLANVICAALRNL
jgi:hypothetical protein